MKAFKVSGTFMMKPGWQPFSKEVLADSEARARENILSDLGSKHRAKRRQIKIEKVVEIKVDEIEDPLLRAQAKK